MDVASGQVDRRGRGRSSGKYASGVRRWAGVRDLVIGSALVAGLWVTVVPAEGSGRTVQLSLAALAVVGVVVSRRRPVLGVAVAGLATGIAWVLGLTADPFVLTGFAVLRLAETRGVRRFPWSLCAVVVVVAVVSLGFGADGIEDRVRGMLLGVVVLAASWVLGVRTRRMRAEVAARARAEERLRLARDVHDVLSHSLGTIGVRAGVSAHVSALGEAELRDVLREIEADSRSSLSDLKQLLQAEREVASTPASVPLMDALADVVRSAERSGIASRFDSDGDLDGLPATVRTTVLRVVQESVTNVIRHSSASSVAVRLSVSADAVDVEVRDDGRGAPSGFREGHGLMGMRERVELVGGILDIGSSGEGFAVSVRLPLTVAAGEPTS
ncbi:sensor histidine kinase [Labedella endophytica]|uniref:histidine kinase n=1 Tax=Labedella endophytica TaxID=1523160 RepID=A0A433JU06_9MICO|nr:ATP-binding protein [Labedella endophytica]RUR01544.1 hypothetical protein ELQ94_08615 [Labedella endophytica]